MPALPTLVPNSDSQVGTWTTGAGGTTNLYLGIDETVGTPDGTTIRGPAGTASTGTNSYEAGLTNMPADFLNMTSMSHRVRYAQTGRADDTIGFRYRIINSTGTTVLAGATSTLTTAWVTFAAITTTTQTNSTSTAFAYVNTTATQTDWNGALLEIEQTYTSSMANDNARILIDAIEFTGVYTAGQRRTVTNAGTGTQTATGNVIPGAIRRTATGSGAGADVAATYTIKTPTRRTATGSGTGTQTATGVRKIPVRRTARGLGSEYLSFSNDVGSTSSISAGQAVETGQSFTPDRASSIREVKFYLARTGVLDGNAVARVYSHTGTFGSSGVPLTLLAESSPISASSIPTSPGWVSFTFPQGSRATVQSGTSYFVTVRHADGGTGSLNVYLGFNLTGAIAPGNGAYRTLAGAWQSASTWDVAHIVQSTITDAIGSKVIRRTATGSGLGTQSATGVASTPIKRTATGSGLGTENAPWTNPTVLKTYTVVPTATAQVGNWRTSTGASVNLHLDVDEAYESPDSVAIRGAAGVTDTVTTGMAALTTGAYSFAYTAVRLRSARVRFRWRAVGLVDDSISLEFALAATGTSTSFYAGQTSTTRVSRTITSSTFVDSGWIDFPFVSSSVNIASSNMRLQLRQVVTVNGTNDNAYIEIDTIEVETTQITRATRSGASEGVSNFLAHSRTGFYFSFTSFSNFPYISQQFTAVYSGKINSAEVSLSRNTGTGNAIAYIYSVNPTTGNPVELIATSNPVAISTITTSPSGSFSSFTKFVFPDGERTFLTEGANYALVVHVPTATSTITPDYLYLSSPYGYKYPLKRSADNATWSTVFSGGMRFQIEGVTALSGDVIASGIGTSSQTATGTVTVPGGTSIQTAIRPLISTSQIGNWLNSAGNTTNLHTYIDESYASPDGLFVRGAAGVTDTSATRLQFGMTNFGGGVYSTRLRSARIRFRWRVVNRVDDDVSLSFALTSTSGAAIYAGETSNSFVTRTITSSTFVDSGWIDFPYENTISTPTLHLAINQNVTVNGTNDNAYVEIDTIEVEATVYRWISRNASGYGNATYFNSYLPNYSTSREGGALYLISLLPPPGGSIEYAQSFTAPRTTKILTAGFVLDDVNTPTGSLTARLYTHSGTFGTTGVPGTLLAESTSISASAIPPSSGAYVTFTFPTKPSITSGTNYFIAVRYPDGTPTNHFLAYATRSPTFAPGNGAYFTTSWNAESVNPTDLIYRLESEDAIGRIRPVRSATGSGTGNQTAQRRVRPRRAATGSGFGNQNAAGAIKLSKAATGSGAGTQAATFRRNLRRTSTNAGVGTQAVTQRRTRIRTITNSGLGTQTAIGYKKKFRTATGSGTSNQTTTIRRARGRNASGSGTSTQTAVYRIKPRRAATGSGLGTQVATGARKLFRTATGSGVGNHFISTRYGLIRNAQGFGGAVTGNEAIGLHTAPRTASGQGNAVDNPYDLPQPYDEHRFTYDQSPGSTTFIRALRRFSIANGLGAATVTQRQAAGFLRTALGTGLGTATAPSYFATPVSRTGSAAGQGTQTDTNVTISTTHGIGAAYWGIPALVE